MAKRKTPTKKSIAEGRRIRSAFADGTLTIADLGAFFETIIEYRGYYVERRRTQWAGPWRNDNLAAAADVFPYVQQGLETGISMRQREEQ